MLGGLGMCVPLNLALLLVVLNCWLQPSTFVTAVCDSPLESHVSLRESMNVQTSSSMPRLSQDGP